MQLIDHMALQLRAGREQKAWQPFGDWHLVSSLPPSFVLLSLSLLISISSLFNWLSVKVLLSASTCPCHSKQRQLGDAAFSLLSPVSALSFCPLLLLSFIPSPLHFLPRLPSSLFFLWHFSPSLYHSLFLSRSGIFFCFPFIPSHPFSYSFAVLPFAFLGLVTNVNHRLCCPFSCVPRLQSLGSQNSSPTPFLSS